MSIQLTSSSSLMKDRGGSNTTMHSRTVLHQRPQMVEHQRNHASRANRNTQMVGKHQQSKNASRTHDAFNSSRREVSNSMDYISFSQDSFAQQEEDIQQQQNDTEYQYNDQSSTITNDSTEMEMIYRNKETLYSNKATRAMFSMIIRNDMFRIYKFVSDRMIDEMDMSKEGNMLTQILPFLNKQNYNRCIV